MSDNVDKMAEACVACALKDRCVQTVDECFTRRQRWKALLLGYILPFLVLSVGIIVMSLLHWDEMLIGGISLAIVGIYYVVLWLCKPKI